MRSEYFVSAISGVAAHAKRTQEVRYAACFLASGQQKSLMKRQFCLLQLHNRMSGNVNELALSACPLASGLR